MIFIDKVRWNRLKKLLINCWKKKDIYQYTIVKSGLILKKTIISYNKNLEKSKK